MVGVSKAEIQSCDLLQLNIEGEDETVDHIVLRVGGIARIIGLVQQAAGGGAGVIGEVPALGKKAVIQNPGGPERGIEDRIGLETAGEGLVESPPAMT